MSPPRRHSYGWHSINSGLVGRRRELSTVPQDQRLGSHLGEIDQQPAKRVGRLPRSQSKSAQPGTLLPGEMGPLAAPTGSQEPNRQLPVVSHPPKSDVGSDSDRQAPQLDR